VTARGDGTRRVRSIRLIAAVTVLALAGAVAATARADDAPANPAPPRPANHPGDWASDNDYPYYARRIGAVGVVVFELAVGANGVPTACQVIASSRNDLLDKTTCKLMMERARFVPATDAAGKPVAGSYRNEVRWQIPDGPPPMPAASRLSATYDVMSDGTVANCKVIVTGAILAKIQGNPQSYCTRIGPFAPAVDAHGNRLKKHIVVENSITITDTP